MPARRLRSNWERLDRPAVRALQAARLRRTLGDVVVPFSPFYRRLFAAQGLDPRDLRTLDDLASVPFTMRADLLPSPDRPGGARDFLVVPDLAVLRRRPSFLARALLRGRRRTRAALEREYRPILATSTTGRSGEPVSFLFTRRDVDTLASAGRRLIAVAGIPPDDRLVNLFPFAPHLAFWQTHYAAASAGLFCVSTGGGRFLGTSRTLALLERVRPGSLVGMPTFLYHLLHQAGEEGRRLEGLRALVLGGEKVPPGMRRKLRELAAAVGSEGVRVVATYGFTEARMAFAECPGGAEGGYHVPPDLAVIEVVDPETGRPLPDGTPGEVVFTPLDGRGTVVLRYRTGDVISGGLFHGECPGCGRRLPRLVGDISRLSDARVLRLGKIKGTLVDFNDIERILDDADLVGAWQVEIRKVRDDPLDLDRLVVHVQPRRDAAEGEILDEVNRRFAALTEVRADEVQLHTAAEMRALHGVGTELKEKRVVDNRPPAVAPAAAPVAPAAPAEA